MDPKAQKTADEAKDNEPQEKADESTTPKEKIMSQMLLNKFQHDQERRQYREEAARRHEGHWRCPFFMYYWEEGLTLPTMDNCQECNDFYHEDRSYKKPRFDQRPSGPTRTMLCDPTGGRISADERVEQIANSRVPDEYPHRRDPEREPVHDNID